MSQLENIEYNETLLLKGTKRTMQQKNKSMFGASKIRNFWGQKSQQNGHYLLTSRQNLTSLLKANMIMGINPNPSPRNANRGRKQFIEQLVVKHSDRTGIVPQRIQTKLQESQHPILVKRYQRKRQQKSLEKDLRSTSLDLRSLSRRFHQKREGSLQQINNSSPLKVGEIEMKRRSPVAKFLSPQKESFLKHIQRPGKERNRKFLKLCEKSLFSELRESQLLFSKESRAQALIKFRRNEAIEIKGWQADFNEEDFQ